MVLHVSDEPPDTVSDEPPHSKLLSNVMSDSFESEMAPVDVLAVPSVIGSGPSNESETGPRNLA